MVLELDRSDPEEKDIVCLSVKELPAVLAQPISLRDQLTLVEPFTLLLSLPIVIVLAVPHVAVVIPADPSKFVPLIARVLVNLLAEPTIALAILPE